MKNRLLITWYMFRAWLAIFLVKLWLSGPAHDLNRINLEMLDAAIQDNESED